jgi:hypothetical protein
MFEILRSFFLHVVAPDRDIALALKTRFLAPNSIGITPDFLDGALFYYFYSSILTIYN